MSDGDERDVGKKHVFGMQIGVVVERKDPKKLGRVRIRIPGYCEDRSAWAFPIGAPGGGSAQRGFKWVPPIGAEVAVWFRGGNIDDPRYMPAHWGILDDSGSEMPTASKDLSADDAPDVHSIEWAKYSIEIDEREGHESLIIRDKDSGDNIEFDGRKESGPGIVIQASAGLSIIVDGILNIAAGKVVINGRNVGTGNQEL